MYMFSILDEEAVADCEWSRKKELRRKCNVGWYQQSASAYWLWYTFCSPQV